LEVGVAVGVGGWFVGEGVNVNVGVGLGTGVSVAGITDRQARLSKMKANNKPGFRRIGAIIQAYSNIV
jgi:hypothetical protein